MIHGSNNTNACGCDQNNDDENNASGLFLGSFPALDNIITLHPAPVAGSYAYITRPGTVDDIAVWDAGDSQWRNIGPNNTIRQFPAGITNAAYPFNGVINFPFNLSVSPNEIVVLTLIRIIPPRPGSFMSIMTKERYLWGKGKGEFNPIGNVTVGPDIIYMGTDLISEEDLSNAPNTVTRAIGTIPSGQDLDSYINSLGPGQLIDLTDNTKRYFLSFEQDAVIKLASFAGAQSAHGFGFYGSSSFGGLQAAPGDFTIVGNNAGTALSLEDVTATGPETTHPMTVLGAGKRLTHQADKMVYTGTNGFTVEHQFKEAPGNVTFNLPENKTGQHTYAMTSDVVTRAERDELMVTSSGAINNFNAQGRGLLTFTNPATLNGINASGFYEGREIFILNASSEYLNINHLNTSSAAANRIFLSGGNALPMRPNSFIRLRYSVNRSRFELVNIVGTDVLPSLVYAGNEQRVVTITPDGVAYAEPIMDFEVFDETTFGFASLAAIVDIYPTSSGWRKGLQVICPFMPQPTIYKKCGDGDDVWLRIDTTITRMI